MASSLTWLDYSEQDRRKMLDVISLFREQTTRDELGLGTIRDAFAEMFFPGTSTIQTRARYFLFIPWMYQALLENKTPPRAVDQKLRQREVELIYVLAKAADNEGTIGKVALAGLKRLSSNIYWNGLREWGIRSSTLGSQSEYHQSFADFYPARHHNSYSEEEGQDERPFYDWHPYLPHRPENFPAEATFQLTRKEADYLADRITHTHRASLLAYLVNRYEPLDFRGFAWDHPNYNGFPKHLHEQLFHARNFSEVAQGAALLYNLMLANDKPSADLEDQYRGELEQWAYRLESRQDELASWNLDDFWILLHSYLERKLPRTESFVNSWIHLALQPDIARTIADHPPARDLVKHREAILKRKNARLGNPRALELWQGDAGTAQLDFRWFTAKRILNDILDGLMQEDTDHAAA
jgi:hypothetical protein